MNRASKIIVLCLVVVFVILATIIGAERFSPPQQTQAQQPSAYVVKKGDTLWSLAGSKLDDPKLWKQVVEKNPFMQAPGRVFYRNGRPYAIIKPDEKLHGLEILGVTAMSEPSGWFANKDWKWWAMNLLGVAIALWLIAYGCMAAFLWNKPAKQNQPVSPVSSEHLRAVH